jgi:hypothetical protein
VSRIDWRAAGTVALGVLIGVLIMATIYLLVLIFGTPSGVAQ